jgi:nitroreductase
MPRVVRPGGSRQACPYDSIGVTDNDWFVYVTLLKQGWSKAQGLRCKAAKPNWAKSSREFPFPCAPRTSSFRKTPPLKGLFTLDRITMIVENTDLFCYSLSVIEPLIINKYHTQGRSIMNTIPNLVARLIVTVLLVCPSVTSAKELKPIKLSNPQMDIGRPLMQVLKDRSSSRAFSTENVPLHVVSDLLWAAFGINRPDSGKRTAPSARNWQEIDIYVATADGLYLYEARAHTLTPILAGDIRAMTGRQGFVRDVPVNLIYVANFSRMGNAPTDEKIFYSAADTGFISQNVYLYCASEGLATFVRALIDRPALAKAMRLRADQRVILAQSVGYPKR